MHTFIGLPNEHFETNKHTEVTTHTSAIYWQTVKTVSFLHWISAEGFLIMLPLDGA